MTATATQPMLGDEAASPEQQPQQPAGEPEAETDTEYVAIKVGEMLTPVQIEQFLTAVFNALAKNQLVLMRLRSEEMDAKIDYERAHLIATTDPLCPVVERGGTTVAERDDWVRGVEFEEYAAYEVAKKRTRNCRDYLEMLKEQGSLLQSMNRSVLAGVTAGRN